MKKWVVMQCPVFSPFLGLDVMLHIMILCFCVKKESCSFKKWNVKLDYILVKTWCSHFLWCDACLKLTKLEVQFIIFVSSFVLNLSVTDPFPITIGNKLFLAMIDHYLDTYSQ